VIIEYRTDEIMFENIVDIRKRGAFLQQKHHSLHILRDRNTEKERFLSG